MQRTLDDVWLMGDFESVSETERLRLRKRKRLVLIGGVGISYAIDALLLLLFYFAGTVGSAIVAFYFLAGIGHVLLFSTLQLTGLAERARNPHFPGWQMAYSVVVQIIAIQLAPKLATFFLAIMFIIFAFGALRLSLRQLLLFCMASCLGVAVALLNSREAALSLDRPSLVEAVLIWATFTLVLMRTILIGYYSAALHIRLLDYSTRLAASVEKAEAQATHDVLTGLLNRRAIYPLIADQISLFQRQGIPACVAMVDIDHFKHVNDRCGHLIGDQVLQGLAREMQASVRVSDHLARFGGEEFLLLLPATSLEQGQALMERLRLEIQAYPWQMIAPGIAATISIGIAELRPSDDEDSVLARADAALYRAKQSGRNRVVSEDAKSDLSDREITRLS